MTRYAAILADPPWPFRAWSGAALPSRVADAHYQTMPWEEIAALPVADFAADDCALFCWACWPSLPEALQVIAGWGFSYKTLAFNWVKGEGLPLFPDDIKDQVGLGYWTRANTEPCILAVRGKPKRLNADVRQVILDRRREHSRKPDDVHKRIERLVTGPYLELFARQRRPGWDVAYSNEADKFAPASCGLRHCPEVCLDGYCASKDGALSYEAACKALAERREARAKPGNLPQASGAVLACPGRHHEPCQLCGWKPARPLELHRRGPKPVARRDQPDVAAR